MKGTLISLIVGDHFRPPAKLVLAALPAGATLALEPEPENPYDPDAVRVMVDPAQIPESQFDRLSQELPLMGFTLEQVMSGGPLQLGYVPKSGGKPLLKAQAEDPGTPLVGNAEIKDWVSDPEHQAVLGFGPQGGARVLVMIDEPEEG